ncbi:MULTISPECIES: HNH endonuclease [Bacillus]|nr:MULTISPECIES: HNH endonuclease [Bacillus cereus group]MCC2541649.1 HNH endonuclease [Bacillus thuringiensis]MCU5235566.1 HNH endonuclease [Bacillus cereus]MCU5539065.1 HNH endonuclease [Bacillus cereus]NNG93845.1 HNH endonuclease [Bacillus thuringiensis]PES89588.1 HNH endonuclease [Bacillus thuringiensis]
MNLNSMVNSALKEKEISKHSWALKSNNIAMKKMDKSSFINNETGIPIDIRSFFEIDVMKENSNFQITLEFMKQDYLARIRKGLGEKARTKLLWPSKLTEYVQMKYPIIYEEFRKGNKVDDNVPYMIFKKIDEKYYKVSFSTSLEEYEGIGSVQVTSTSKLEPVKRNREYSSYGEEIRDSVVYEYLFNAKSQCWIDENILGLDSKESKGYEAMGILHHIGIKNDHKGIFEGINISDALSLLQKEMENFNPIKDVLIRLSEEAITITLDTHVDEEDDFPEGKEKFRLHRYRERNNKLVKQAKERFIQVHGRLYCEACGMDFEQVYGDRGRNFIEAHHRKPISEMKNDETTKIEDLAMLCPNCHSMIHRKPLVTVEELRVLIQSKGKFI